MDCQVPISEAALADLEEILAHSWVNLSAATEHFGNGILNHFELLRALPYVGTPVAGRPGVQQLVHTPIVIYYRVHESPNVVEILRFRHSARGEMSVWRDIGLAGWSVDIA